MIPSFSIGTLQRAQVIVQKIEQLESELAELFGVAPAKTVPAKSGITVRKNKLSQKTKSRKKTAAGGNPNARGPRKKRA
jgi:hypothetical protein